MRVDAFDFDLPKERIAQHPVEPRDAARLLVVRENGFEDRIFRDLPDLLRAGDVLVCNDTKVIPSRLTGRRRDAKIEVTLHEPKPGSDREGVWRAFARPAKKLKAGDEIIFAEDFSARVTEKLKAGEITLDFPCSEQELLEGLWNHGAVPLPPYIKRDLPEDRDREDYQTLFAEKEGAVAAPTAGLHFTERVRKALEERGIHMVFVTLHVGAGTFLPIKTERTEDHRMHAERGEISKAAADAINAARGNGGRIVAVGSTPLRLLETASDENGVTHPWRGATDIFITPGYRFKAVDLMVTNFHLPKSTLFMLVTAFSGLDRMRRAYAHAIREGYRFYSYGDCCLLERMDEQ